MKGLPQRKINANMARIVAKLLGRRGPLSRELAGLLRQGIADKGKCILLKGCAKGSGGFVPRPYWDRTGHECFVNHIHIDPKHRGDPKPLSQGLMYAEQLAQLLRDSPYRGPFRVILSFHLTDWICTVRFHRVRPGEIWHDENLDAYKEEAILIIDC